MFRSDQNFSSEEVAALARVTPRQLQWWDERGVVSPEHQGHRRRYRLEELIEVAVIAELRSKGFSLQKIRSSDEQLSLGSPADKMHLSFQPAGRPETRVAEHERT